MGKTIPQIKTDMENTMRTQLQTKMNQLFLSEYSNVSVGSDMRIYPVTTDSGIIYEMYPKVWFKADSLNDRIQHNVKIDSMINDLKDIIDLYLKSNGATNITWYLDYSSGEQRIEDFSSFR